MKKFIFLLFLLSLVFSCFTFANSGEIQEEFDTAKYWSNGVEPKEDRVPIRVELISKHVAVQKYNIGDKINLTGLRADVWYDDMSIEPIDCLDDRIVTEGFENDKLGDSLVTVYFECDGLRQCLYQFKAEVLEEPINRGKSSKKNTRSLDDIVYMYIIQYPEKSVYLLGEEIDLTGAVFFVRKGSNEIGEERIEEMIPYNEDDFTYEITNCNNMVPGFQSVEVEFSYKGYSTSDWINIVFKERESDKIVTKLEVIDDPEVVSESEVDWSNALLQVEYDDKTSDFIEYNPNKIKYELDYQDYNGFYYLEIKYYENINDDYDTAIYEYLPLSVLTDFSSFDEKSINYSFSDDRTYVKQNLYNLDNLPEVFNLRDKINIEVGNQGGWGLCWDFASTKSLETNFHLKYGIEYDLSEKYGDYLTSKVFYGIRNETDGGTGDDYSNEMQITGVPTEEKVPYVQVDASKYDELENVEKVVQPLSSAIFYQPSLFDNKAKLKQMVKAHVMNYGSMYVAVHWNSPGDEKYFYNIYEMPRSYSVSGHAISIIGWDDTISKELFTKQFYNGMEFQPEHDGAWIAQNSWGESFGFDNGLFYISYDTDMSYFGFLDSKPYTNNNIYVHERYRKNRSWEDAFDDNNDKTYYYVEFDKSSKIEYLTNIIVPGDYPNAKYYLLSNYDSIETANFSNLIHLGDHIVMGKYGDCLNANLIFDRPYRIDGNKFLIVMEIDKNYCTEGAHAIDCQNKDDDIHSYYSYGELTNYPEQLRGDVILYAFTIDRAEYISQMNNEINKIEIYSLPNKTTFSIGRDIDLTGGQIRIFYENEDVVIKSMTDEDVYWYGYTDYDKTVGNKEIRVFYGDKFVSFNIEIIDDIDRIEMYDLPRTVYNYYGLDEITGERGSIKVYYQDGSSTILPLDDSSIIISPNHIDYSDSGNHTIEVDYYGHKTSYDIEVASRPYIAFRECKL